MCRRCTLKSGKKRNFITVSELSCKVPYLNNYLRIEKQYFYFKNIEHPEYLFFALVLRIAQWSIFSIQLLVANSTSFYYFKWFSFNSKIVKFWIWIFKKFCYIHDVLFLWLVSDGYFIFHNFTASKVFVLYHY